MVTRRENLLRIFQHQIPERLPVAGHVDPYNQPSRQAMEEKLKEQLGKVEWGSQATVVFSRYLGLDVMEWYKIPVRVTRRKVMVESFHDNQTSVRLWETPAGQLREVIRYCPGPGDAFSYSYIEHLVKKPADLDALAAIFEDEIVELDEKSLAEVKQRQQLIGEDGILLGPMEGTPLGMMYRVFSGVETLAYLWIDAPDTLRDCFSVMEKAYLKRLEIGCLSAVDAIVGVDDTSTTAISPQMFEKCNLELIAKRVSIAHARGKLYFHHSCGHIRNLLSLYRKTKMDAVHAFTIPPLGDVTVGEGRRLLGDRITIIAGLGQLAGPMDNLAAVKQSIWQMLSEAKPWDHFVLLVAAYPHRTMAETRFVVDCCREFEEKVFKKAVDQVQN